MRIALHGLWHLNTYSLAMVEGALENASPELGFETRNLKPLPLSFLLLHVHGRDESPQLPASVTVPLSCSHVSQPG